MHNDAPPAAPVEPHDYRLLARYLRRAASYHERRDGQCVELAPHLLSGLAIPEVLHPTEARSWAYHLDVVADMEAA